MRNRERDRLWRRYLQNVGAGLQHSLRDWGIPVGQEGSFGLVSDAQSDKEVQERVARLIAMWVSQADDTDASGKGGEMTDERKIIELGLEFLKAADQVRPQRFYKLLDAGVPVNFQHPQYLETAIHITCSRNVANALTERLLTHREIDLLLRDQFGRQAWNNAELFGINPELAKRVLDATLKQVEQQQINLETFRQEYQKYLSSWMDQEWYWHLARHSQYTREP